VSLRLSLAQQAGFPLRAINSKTLLASLAIDDVFSALHKSRQVDVALQYKPDLQS
jgi:hypothetical protein